MEASDGKKKLDMEVGEYGESYIYVFYFSEELHYLRNWGLSC